MCLGVVRGQNGTTWAATSTWKEASLYDRLTSVSADPIMGHTMRQRAEDRMHTVLCCNTRADRVAQHPVDFIDEQRLAPSAPLPSEAKPIREVGVSRPIIREALR